MVKALVERGAIINVIDDHGNTPLHCAVLWGDSEIVQYLIEQGALTHVRNFYGDTPLNTAEIGGREDIVNMLRPHYEL